MPKISVIIPVYNTKVEYLECAINSVLKQTFKDIEIIIVNDGSTDESLLHFLTTLKKKQIIVVNQNNLGLGGARNTGIKKASGEYIGFLDSDDWIDKVFYEILYNTCEENGADIACGVLSVSNRDNSIHNLDKYKKLVTSKNLIKIKYITNGSVCSKIFKKSLFDDNLFIEHLYYEDNPVLLKALIKSKRVAYVPSVHYYYRQHENSIVHDVRLAEKRKQDIFIVLTEISKILNGCTFFVRHAAERRFSKILLGVSHYKKNKEYKKYIQTILQQQQTNK